MRCGARPASPPCSGTPPAASGQRRGSRRSTLPFGGFASPVPVERPRRDLGQPTTGCAVAQNWKRPSRRPPAPSRSLDEGRPWPRGRTPPVGVPQLGRPPCPGRRGGRHHTRGARSPSPASLSRRTSRRHRLVRGPSPAPRLRERGLRRVPHLRMPRPRDPRRRAPLPGPQRAHPGRRGRSGCPVRWLSSSPRCGRRCPSCSSTSPWATGHLTDRRCGCPMEALGLVAGTCTPSGASRS